MFDIGFWEMCLVVLVGLLVFGPEKLPEVARTLGLWTGRIRRLMNTVKLDIDRELHLQELQQTLKDNNNSIHQFLEEGRNGLRELDKPVISQEPTPALSTPSPQLADNPAIPVSDEVSFKTK